MANYFAQISKIFGGWLDEMVSKQRHYDSVSESFKVFARDKFKKHKELAKNGIKTGFNKTMVQLSNQSFEDELNFFCELLDKTTEFPQQAYTLDKVERKKAKSIFHNGQFRYILNLPVPHYYEQNMGIFGKYHFAKDIGTKNNVLPRDATIQQWKQHIERITDAETYVFTVTGQFKTALIAVFCHSHNFDEQIELLMNDKTIWNKFCQEIGKPVNLTPYNKNYHYPDSVNVVKVSLTQFGDDWYYKNGEKMRYSITNAQLSDLIKEVLINCAVY